MSCSASCSGRRYGSIFSCSVPGRKPEPLPRLDRGPGQDDPRHLLGLQRLHRLRHGEVGLAGTGRTDAEHDGVRVDRVDVALLVQRLRPDRLAAPRQDVEGQYLGGRLLSPCVSMPTVRRTASGVSGCPRPTMEPSSAMTRSASATSPGRPVSVTALPRTWYVRHKGHVRIALRFSSDAPRI